MRRAARLALWASLVVAIGVVGASAWLAYSPRAVHWLAGVLVERSQGRLEVVGVDGSLARGVALERVVYHHEGLRVEVDQANVVCSWPALLRGQVRFSTLRVSRIDVTLPPAAEPTQLPDSLVSPLEVAIGEGRIDRLAVRLPGRVVMLEGIELRGGVGRQRHTLELHAARASDVLLGGRFEIGARAPFALHAKLALRPNSDPRIPVTSIELVGDLKQIRARFQAQADWLDATGTALLMPFESTPVRRLQASVEKALPHRLWPQGLQASLNGRLELEQVGDGRFAGHVHAENAQPGEVGNSRLPLVAIDTSIAGTLEAQTFTGLELRTARGAQFRGNGKAQAGAVDLELKAAKVDLKEWDRRLVATHLAGSLKLIARAEDQRVIANLGQDQYRIEIDANRRANEVTVRRASAVARGGELVAAGQISLTPAYAFEAKGHLHRFDPSAFLEVPKAQIDANIETRGHLAPSLEARLLVQAKGHAFDGRAFTADATARLLDQRLHELNATVSAGRNSLTITGAYGAPNDALRFDAKMRALSDLDRRFSGTLDATGKIAGTLTHPEIVLEARGSGLAGPGKVRIGTVRVRAALPSDWDKALDVDLMAADVAVDASKLGRTTLVVHGTPRAHSMDVAVLGGEIEMTLRLAGSLQSLRAWNGQIASLQVQKPAAVALQAPARLLLAPDKVDVGPLLLSASEARFSITQLSWTPLSLRSRGDFVGLKLAPLLPLAASRLQSTLVLDGNWNIEHRDGVLNGGLDISRRAGDILISADTQLPLSLSALTLQAKVESNRVRASAEARSASLGQLHFSGTTNIGHDANRWSIPGDAPVTFEAQGEFPSVAWIGPLIHPSLVVTGSAKLRASGRGTWAAPNVQGVVQGSALTLRNPALGVVLTDGVLEAAITDDRIRLQTLRFKGGDGEINVEGEAGLRKAEGVKLRVLAKQLRLLNRRDAQLEVNASGDVFATEASLRVQGEVQVTRAHFELGSRSARPALASDIHVKNAAVVKPSAPLRLDVDVTTDFGDRFTVAARGLGQTSETALRQLAGEFKARVQGQIRTRSDAQQVPQTTGTLRLVDATYAAVGRQFMVRRGSLRFVGPIANPILDIFVAPAKTDFRFTPEVGISISGSATAPRVHLVSQPEMPESEKLSWLLFGRGGQSVDYAVGSTAQQVAAPITEFGLQVSQNLYVAYEQGATGTQNAVRIYNQLTDRIAVQASAGHRNSLYLLYTFLFD